MGSGSWRGAALMLLAGVLSTAVAIYDFYNIASGIDDTGGVELVIASSLLMVFGALMVIILRAGFLAGIFLFLLLLDVIGTGLAAYFLESGLIMAAMAAGALGWVLHMNRRGRAA